MYPDTSKTNSFRRDDREGYPRPVTRVRQSIDAPAPQHSVTEPDLVTEHQQNMPEGQGAIVEERKVVPWVIAILATSVLIAGALVIGFSFGWIAAVVGIVWLLLGYAVSWSVVWGAGLFRAQDEEIVEEKIDMGEMPPPPGRVG